MKKSSRLVLGLGLILLVLSAFVSNRYYRMVTQKQPGADQTREFTVNAGESVASIAERLAKDKLISSTLLFRIYLKLNNMGATLQSGVFSLSGDLSIKEVSDVLQHGVRDLKLTFPEGWRREEMARYLVSKISAQDFLAETSGSEGYLFPDTYSVPAWYTAKQLVVMMKDNFDQKYLSLPKTTLSKDKVVILASLVEREAKYDNDRPIVAGILLKRLNNDWPLEVDATLQYALANRKMDIENWKEEGFVFWPREITADDLQLSSPYNTRKNRGLPPTPICNPGLAALKAVVSPQETDYWFYLSDPSGRMHYAKTVEEHNANAARYL